MVATSVTSTEAVIPAIKRAAEEPRGGFGLVAAGPRGKQLRGQGELQAAKERARELTAEHKKAREALRKLGWRMRNRRVGPATGEVLG